MTDDARKALADALMRAIDGLTNYADDLDATERPAIGEYDVTADIRLVCQALIDRHAADIAEAALDNLPRVTVREGFERRTGQATPNPLPGTREEVARPAGTQDREAIYERAWSVYVDTSIDVSFNSHDYIKAVVDAVLAALPPAPMPEREGMREALKFYADEWFMNGDGDSETPGLSRSWMEPTEALLNDEGRKARAALAPHDKTEG